MSEKVPADQIEGIVGVSRHPTDHYARAVSAEQTVYILHSQECLNSGMDLRDCRFSRALDRGIDLHRWVEDVPVVAAVQDGRLIPYGKRRGEG